MQRGRAFNVLRLPSRFTALAAGMVVAACAVGPDYQRPPAEAPRQFKEAAGAWKVGAPGDVIARGAWWEIFGDPQLNALEEQVAIANQNIRVAEAQVRQAVALTRSARAQFLPTLEASALASRGRSANPGGGFSIGPSQRLASEASWELDLWGRIRRTVEANQADAQASAADLAAVRLSAQATLAQNYFQWRTTEVQQAVLQRIVANDARFLQLVRNQYAVGVAQRSDVLAAQTRLKQAQAQRFDTEAARAQFEHAIAVLIGKAPSAFSLTPTGAAAVQDLPPLPDIPLDVPSAVLERRPDVAAAERRMAAANARIGVARAAYFPVLTLGASAGLSAQTLSRLATLPARTWSIGPSLAATLFDGGARARAVDGAGAAYDQSVAAYRQTVLGALQEVEDYLAALRWQAQEFDAQNDAVKFAREAARLDLNRYRTGTISFLEVMVSQTTACDAEQALLTLQGQRYVAAVSLIKALGGGWHAEVPRDGP